MKHKKVILKLLTLLAWLLVGAGMITLLAAANSRKRSHLCREVRITIKGDGEKFFIDKDDIMLQLTLATQSALVNRPLDQFNLSRLEKSLEEGVWIRDAQLYVDSKDVLHVLITEREPIARVFTVTGNSYYIDSSGKQLPLLEKESARVLAITNFTAAQKYSKQDSLQAKDVKTIANILYNDPFWRKQIAQVDITPTGLYEAIPLVGNHVIRLGKADNLKEKLNRLMVFYKKILSKTGFDKYPVIDVQYDKQVLGINKVAAQAAIDSALLQKNIEDLLARSRQQMMEDSLAQVQRITPLDSAVKRTPVAVRLDTARTGGNRLVIGKDSASHRRLQTSKPLTLQQRLKPQNPVVRDSTRHQP